MDIITIDFETYYDKTFTLSKLTTEQYVRDEQFEIIGVGAKVNNNPAEWYSGDDVKGFLESLGDLSNSAILCHNTVFDGAILSWRLGITPKLWLDTLSMSRPFHGLTVGGSLAKLAEAYNLGEKGQEVTAALGKRRADFTEAELARYGQYCVNDVELTKALFDKLKVGFPVTELMVIDQTIRMYTEPAIELDASLLEQHLEAVRMRKQELLERFSNAQEMQDILMSNGKFASYLQSLGVEPPTKVSARTGRVTWAFAKTDKGMTDLLDHPDERVQIAAAARLGIKSTLEETRTGALLAVASRGRLPIMLTYYGAHTGRFSGGDKLNLQNLPSRGDTTIRKALKAPPGHVLISCDSSQIEARTVAWVSQQYDLVEAFAQKRDIYCEFASEVYGRTITKADKVERFVGKCCVLGLGYGMGADKFQRTLEIGQGGISVSLDASEAQRIVQLYRQKNQRVAKFWWKCDNALKGILYGASGRLHPQVRYDYKGICLPNGFYVQYPGLRETSDGFSYVSRRVNRAEVWTNVYGGKVTENIVQALAALIIREQMASIGQRYKVVFQVHDEIIVCVPESGADMAQAELMAVMATPPKWAPDLPLACESGVAVNYGET